jgi:hypothetical protein
MVGLAEVGQEDFSSGMWRSVAMDKIPRNGLYNIEEFLLDDDGGLYRRGMATRYSTQIAAAPAVGGLWDLSFVPGRRTFFAGSGYTGALNGVTPIKQLFGGIQARPGPAAKIGDLAYIPGLSTLNGGALYGGSLKTAAYNSGTITCTAGSASIVGVGTAWLANADAGMLFRTDSRRYVVQSVDSDTQITLSTPYEADEAAGAARGYTLEVFVQVLNMKGGLASLNPQRQPLCGPAVAAVANKLWVAYGRRVYQSLGPDPVTGRVRPQDWNMSGGAYTDFHEFPSDVVALAPLRDRLLVFTQDGMYLVSGCAFDLVDANGNPQQRLEKVSDEIVALSGAGVCVASDFVVVAARDGIYKIDSLGQREVLTRSIKTMWQGYVKAGHTPGMPGVFRDHLFVAMGTTDTTLVCRLDRPQRTRVGTIYPWTQVRGALSSSTAQQPFAVKDPNGAAKLISGSDDGYVLDATNIFNTYDAELDADGLATAPTFSTGLLEADGGLVTTRDVTLDYTLSPGAVTPTVVGQVGCERTSGGALIFPALQSLAGAAPANDASAAPYTFATRREGRRFQFEFHLAGGTQTKMLRIRGWRTRFRQRGRRR